MSTSIFPRPIISYHDTKRKADLWEKVINGCLEIFLHFEEIPWLNWWTPVWRRVCNPKPEALGHPCLHCRTVFRLLWTCRIRGEWGENQLEKMNPRARLYSLENKPFIQKNSRSHWHSTRIYSKSFAISGDSLTGVSNRKHIDFYHRSWASLVPWYPTSICVTWGTKH